MLAGKLTSFLQATVESENAALDGHDEGRKVFDGCVADRRRATRAALLSSAQRAFEARAHRSSMKANGGPLRRAQRDVLQIIANPLIRLPRFSASFTANSLSRQR